jgi:hypothetical protein
MTGDMMNLRTLVEKTPNAGPPRDMIGFAAGTSSFRPGPLALQYKSRTHRRQAVAEWQAVSTQPT